MHGFEAEGAAAIVQNKVIESPETIATAIRIGNPASWNLAVEAANESEGEIDAVSDEQIIEAYREIAAKEGIFAEPGSCASLAGVKKHVEAGKIKKGAKVVAVLTGNGLKDPTTAMDVSQVETIALDDSKEALAAYLLAEKAAVL